MDFSGRSMLMMFGCLAIIALFLFGPIFTIWSLNTLFALSIPVTIWTYASVFWLQLILSASVEDSS